MELKSYFCKSLTEFYQISIKILPNLTDFSPQLMACMEGMWPDWISNQVPLAFTSDTLPTRLCGWRDSSGSSVVDNTLDYQSMDHKMDPLLFQSFG